MLAARDVFGQEKKKCPLCLLTVPEAMPMKCKVQSLPHSCFVCFTC